MRHLIIFLSIALLGNAGAAVIYVDADATAGGDGSSWASAFNYLQDALDQTVASQGDEVWIAEGTYFPDDGASVTDGDRAASFTLKDDVALYGGFVGTETDLAQRDWDVYPTILSGEIWVDQVYWSIHVTTAENRATFDGLTITKGNANGSSADRSDVAAAVYGGGNISAANCNFVNNSAEYAGGVAYGGTWVANNCNFSNNSQTRLSIESGGGGVASGSYDDNPEIWTVSNCNFFNNSAWSGGVKGGNVSMFARNCVFSSNSAEKSSGVGDLDAVNCTFNGNRAYRSGVGVVTALNSSFTSNSAEYGGVGSLNATNCIISRNRGYGGGVSWQGNLVLNGCIIAYNSATIDGGVSFAGWTTATNCVFLNNGKSFVKGYVTAVNCTFLGYGDTGYAGDTLANGGTWRIFNSIFHNYSRTFVDSIIRDNYNTDDTTPSPQDPHAYNIIEGGASSVLGTSFLLSEYIIDADPLFVDVSDPDGPDDIFGTADDGLRLQAGSPAIGIGNPDFLPQDTLDVDNDGVTEEPVPLDLAGFIRVQDGSLDLGAYEYEDRQVNQLSWEPAGWVYYAWPYAYDFTQGRWHFFDTTGTPQWRVNLSDGEWATLATATATGWNYYAWPYSYSSDQSTWHWYNSNIQWVIDLVSGDWELFGGSD